MKLPEEIKVAGFTYKVLYPYHFKEGSQEGQSQLIQKEIRLADVDQAGNKVPEQEIMHTLLHETIHAIVREYLPKDMEEEPVTLLANGLYQVLKDNELRF